MSLKIGDKVRDNDPLYTNRVLTIIAWVDNDLALVEREPGGRQTRISIKRIHTDGKQRKSGYSLVRRDRE